MPWLEEVSDDFSRGKYEVASIVCYGRKSSLIYRKTCEGFRGFFLIDQIEISKFFETRMKSLRVYENGRCEGQKWVKAEILRVYSLKKIV